MHEIPVGLEQKAFISAEAFFAIVVKVCQVANVLQFSNGKGSGFLAVCLPESSAARLLGHLRYPFQPLAAKQPWRQMSRIQPPHPISFFIYFLAQKLELK